MATWKEIKSFYTELKRGGPIRWEVKSRWFPIRLRSGRHDYNLQIFVALEFGLRVINSSTPALVIERLGIEQPYRRFTVSWAWPLFKFRNEVFRGQETNTNN